MLIRADAGLRRGAGHVMRCLALAQAWQDREGQVDFACTELPAGLRSRLQEEGIRVHDVAGKPGSIADARSTIDMARSLSAVWTVADGYHFGDDYQRVLGDAGKLLVIDDYGQSEAYVADVVLNQNLGANAEPYARREPHTQLLLGADYAMLRREMLQQRPFTRQGDVRRVLVTMGGSDADNVSSKVLGALACVDTAPLTIDVLVGTSNPHLDKLRRLAEQIGPQAHLHRNPAAVADLMARADVAVSAGGSTCWELAYLGVPTLILVVADNQRIAAEALDDGRGRINLGWHHDCSQHHLARHLQETFDDGPWRRQMSLKGQQLIDGHGAWRVVDHLLAQVPSGPREEPAKARANLPTDQTETAARRAI